MAARVAACRSFPSRRAPARSPPIAPEHLFERARPAARRSGRTTAPGSPGDRLAHLVAQRPTMASRSAGVACAPTTPWPPRSRRRCARRPGPRSGRAAPDRRRWRGRDGARAPRGWPRSPRAACCPRVGRGRSRRPPADRRRRPAPRAPPSVASPRSSWPWKDSVTCAGTAARTCATIAATSAGSVAPRVSVRPIVVAPARAAAQASSVRKASWQRVLSTALSCSSSSGAVRRAWATERSALSTTCCSRRVEPPAKMCSRALGERRNGLAATSISLASARTSAASGGGRFRAQRTQGRKRRPLTAPVVERAVRRDGAAGCYRRPVM
jgi:hypothetical protein